MSAGRRKLLWIGDAVVSSGFARCTHKVLETLQQTWDVAVLGLNYMGDPHAYPYPIYPCWSGGDAFGVNRTAQLVSFLRPDLVIVQNDPWNVPAYMKHVGDVPVVASMPVDGKNCVATKLNGLAGAIFWTEFGLREARSGGYSGPAQIVPLGVDTELYCPRDRAEARRELPEIVRDAFIVGNVNRNQPRKRLDLTVAYFAEWVKSRNVRDAYLYLHVAPTGDQGYDTKQLIRYCGVANRLILSEPEIGFGESEKVMPTVYGCFDVQVSTTQGEGWGLCTMEGMACGIPQIVPDWSALGEWARVAAALVPCTEIAVTPNFVNVVGGVADRKMFVSELDRLYNDRDARDSHREAGLSLVRQERFRWSAIGAQFADALESFVSEQRLRA